MQPPSSWLGLVALGTAVVAVVIIAVFLIRRPVVDLRMKLWLLLGLGVLPGATAAATTAAGMGQTTHREFCGDCHVMQAHFDNATDPTAMSLAARHSRNPFFGDKSCYTCHADYGMYGYALTKLGGMGHVYEYYFRGYRSMTLEEAVEKIHIKKPYDNLNCRQCHTGTLADWRQVPEHESLRAELESNKVSCASAGCHGFAHPFSKKEAGQYANTTRPPLRPGTSGSAYSEPVAPPSASSPSPAPNASAQEAAP